MSKLTNLEYFKALFSNAPVSYKLLKPEQKICVEFVNGVKELTIKGDFPYVWFHVPNEYYRSQGKNPSLFGAILAAMGKINGVADYCFIGKDRSFFIEFKSKGGKLSASQDFFKRWTNEKGIEYFVCYTAQEGLKILKERI